MVLDLRVEWRTCVVYQEGCLHMSAVDARTEEILWRTADRLPNSIPNRIADDEGFLGIVVSCRGRVIWRLSLGLFSCKKHFECSV